MSILLFVKSSRIYAHILNYWMTSSNQVFNFKQPHIIIVMFFFIFFLGWIGILAGWLQNDDLRISSSAAKSLANLDHDDKFKCVYPQKIYLLYPTLRTETEPAVDVVFIHGLLGGVFYTWRQRLKNEDNTLGLIGKRK